MEIKGISEKKRIQLANHKAQWERCDKNKYLPTESPQRDEKIQSAHCACPAEQNSTKMKVYG